MSALIRRYGLAMTAVMAALTAFWLLVLVVLPYFFMAEYSFHPNLPVPEIGGPNDHYTLVNYLSIFEGTDLANWEFPDDLRVFWRTIWASALITLLCLAVCYPIAFYVAKIAAPEKAAFLLLLLIIPFWINEILRTFAWYIILALNGPLNTLLVWLGLLDKPMRFYGLNGVLLGMTYAFLLFMMFPLYNAIETLDRNQIEAARDLGAGPLRIHARVVIPHAKPGIAVGCIMVFVLAASSYIVPNVLGAPGSRFFTETIYQWFFEAQNWPRGAAYAFLLLGMCILFILSMMRIFKVGLTDIAK
jgi:spermidine/putrescine transport system permease protein